jgi:hypothetical protein
MASAFDGVWADNRYYFDPAPMCTLRLAPGDSFKWHLMMETDYTLRGYEFKVYAPFEGTTIFDPDTLIHDWTGTAADYLDLEAFLWDPLYDYFIGGATRVMVGTVPTGTHIAVKLSGRISHDAPLGHYTFSPDVNQCYFIDESSTQHLVGGPTMYLEIAPEYECGDVNLDGRVTIADATYIVSYIYRGGPEPCNPSLTTPSEQNRMER